MQDYGNKYISKYNIEKDLFEINCLGYRGYFCNISPWGHIVLREIIHSFIHWRGFENNFYVLTTDKYQYDLNEPNPPLKTYVYQITSNGE